jgi:hypothetical protein
MEIHLLDLFIYSHILFCDWYASHSHSIVFLMTSLSHVHQTVPTTDDGHTKWSSKKELSPVEWRGIQRTLMVQYSPFPLIGPEQPQCTSLLQTWSLDLFALPSLHAACSNWCHIWHPKYRVLQLAISSFLYIRHKEPHHLKQTFTNVEILCLYK